MKKMVYGVFIAAVFAFCVDMPVHAEEGTQSQWKVSVAPFAWLVGISGTATVKGRDADVSVSFSDILDNLDMAGEIHVEAFNGTYGVFVEPNYLKTTEDTTINLPALGTDLKSKFTSTSLFIEFGAFSRLVDVDRSAIDLIGGLRYFDSENEIKLSIPAAGVARKVTSGDTILDPFVGFRVRSYITDRVSYSLRADVGGLNTGSSSTFTYNLVALLAYDVTSNVNVFGGYRVLSLDYGDSESSFNIMQYGPGLGMNITF